MEEKGFFAFQKSNVRAKDLVCLCAPFLSKILGVADNCKKRMKTI
jgi:hypothetical protein